MKVAIVGAKDRESQQDRELVNELIDKLSAAYSGCMYVAVLTHTGVGKFVRDKCLEKDEAGNFKHQLIECTVRLYARHLSKAETADIFIARNATPFEMSDMLIYFASNDRRGTPEDLLDRMQKAGRPCRVFLPGQPVNIEGL